MTEEQRNDLSAQVRQLADELGLRDWTFTILPEPVEDDGAAAMILPVHGRKHAKLQVCADWPDYPAKREAIVHELLHCHLACATDVIRLDLEAAGLLTAAQHEWLWASFRRQIEYAVDGIAAAIARKCQPVV